MITTISMILTAINLAIVAAYVLLWFWRKRASDRPGIAPHQAALLKLDGGDVLIVRVAQAISTEIAARIRQNFSEGLGPGFEDVRIVILDPTLQIHSVLKRVRMENPE